MAGRAQATALVRDAFRLRMALLPYIYAAFERYRTDGTPPFRALVMDHPDDAACRAVDDQWLIGDDLLFAPVFHGQRSREVVLPPGEWFDMASGRRIAGGQRIIEEVELDRVLLYVRTGAILPLAEPVQSVGRDTAFRLTVRAYGADPRPLELPEDDGESDAYLRGERNRVRLSWIGGAGAVERSGTWAGRRYDIIGWERVGS